MVLKAWDILWGLVHRSVVGLWHATVAECVCVCVCVCVHVCVCTCVRACVCMYSTHDQVLAYR